jgi:hypothetical protein
VESLCEVRVVLNRAKLAKAITVDLHSGNACFKSRPGHRFFPCFPHAFEENAAIVPQIRLRLLFIHPFKFVKMSLCLINKLPRNKDVWRYRGVAPSFLKSALDGGKWSASCPRSLNQREKSPQYPLDMRLGGSQSRFGHCGKEKNP